MSETWDYIVVGGGSAGAVAAARLSEDPTCSVLLLEAGGNGRSPVLRIPSAIYIARASTKLHWFMEVEPDPTRDDRKDVVVCGRGLGGGSSVNGMIFLKGLARDYEAWAAAGPEWSLSAIDDAYRRVEATLGISTIGEPHPVSDRFRHACHAYGLGSTDAELAQAGIGIMPTPANIRGGERRSTAYAYLNPARRRSNLVQKTGCEVLQLITRDGAAVGVRYRENGKEKIARCGEVILSAGAIKTPQILLLSGIGPADELRAVGIEPIVDAAGVGRGLQDHPSLWISMNVTQKTWTDERSPLRMAMAGLQWLARRNGMAGSPLSQFTGYGSTVHGAAQPDYQLIFIPIGYDIRGDGASFLSSSSVTASVSLCQPSGRGSVRLRSSDPAASPLIHYRLLETEAEAETLARAGMAIREIFSTSPMREIASGEVSPGPGVSSVDEWVHYARRNAVNMCHPCGSCRMGADEDATVDSRLRLRGIKGLRIADASIMPNITSGNTNAPAMMIGEQVASLIMQGL